MSNPTSLGLDPDRFTQGDGGYAHFGSVEVEMGEHRIYVPESSLTDIRDAETLATNLERAISWTRHRAITKQVQA